MLLNSVFQMYSFIFTWVYVFVGVCMCADTCRGQRPTLGVSLSFALHLVFWDGGLFLNLELTGSTRPADQKARGSPQCWDYRSVLLSLAPNQVIMVTWQPLCWLSRSHPSNNIPLFIDIVQIKMLRHQSVMLKAKAFHLILLHSWTYPCNSLRISRTRW